jgi:cytosine/adenosine deaminase-related metal-dependent hydrolase
MSAPDFDKILAAAAMIEGYNDDSLPLLRAGKEGAFSRAIDSMNTHSFLLVIHAADLMIGRPCRSPLTNDPEILTDYDTLARHLGASVHMHVDENGIQLHLSPTGRGRLH